MPEEGEAVGSLLYSVAVRPLLRKSKLLYQNACT
jgi:hypothetical protein